MPHYIIIDDFNINWYKFGKINMVIDEWFIVGIKLNGSIS